MLLYPTASLLVDWSFSCLYTCSASPKDHADISFNIMMHNYEGNKCNIPMDKNIKFKQ